MRRTTNAPASEIGLPGATEDRTLVRVKVFSLLAYALIASSYLIRGEWKSFLGLTCSSAVVMINFLWLEEIVLQILQPTPHLKAWRLALRTLARLALFGVAVLIAISVVRFDALSVLLGFSVLVIGIVAEAVYSAMQAQRS